MIRKFGSMAICFSCKGRRGPAEVYAFLKEGEGIKYIKIDCECGYSWEHDKFQEYLNKDRSQQNKLI
jgi:hypothetical protein